MKVKLEEWRIEEIGKLMIEADTSTSGEKERQKIFYEISCAIRSFGLYETAERKIREIVKKQQPSTKEE